MQHDLHMQLRRLKWQAKGLPLSLKGFGNSLRQQLLSARGSRMLVYHGVCRNRPLRFNTLFVTKQHLEAQFRLFKKYFRVVPATDWFNGDVDQDRFTISLSFDDGFASHAEVVLPLLEKYRLPAIFFVTASAAFQQTVLWNDVLCATARYGPAQLTFNGETYYVQAGHRYTSKQGVQLTAVLRGLPMEEREAFIAPLRAYCRVAEAAYWQQLSEKQLRLLSENPLVTIGAHSLLHEDLSCLEGDALRQNLCRSKQILETITGKPVNALAFPYGAYTRATLAAAKDAGYTQLYADLADGEFNNESILRPRFTVNPFIRNLNLLYGTVKGSY